MKEIAIPVEALLALSLPNLVADSKPEQVLEVIRDLAAKAAKVEGLETEVKDLKAELENLKESTISEKINAIVEKALADHKINQATADKLKADYKSNVEGLQALIDAMPAQNTISSQLKAEVPEKYKGKTWNDLYKSGELADIKKNYPEFYKELKEAHEK